MLTGIVHWLDTSDRQQQHTKRLLRCIRWAFVNIHKMLHELQQCTQNETTEIISNVIQDSNTHCLEHYNLVGLSFTVAFTVHDCVVCVFRTSMNNGRVFRTSCFSLWADGRTVRQRKRSNATTSTVIVGSLSHHQRQRPCQSPIMRWWLCTTDCTQLADLMAPNPTTQHVTSTLTQVR